MEKNIYLKNNIRKAYFFRIIRVLEQIFSPLILVLIRLKMGSIFWYSGLTKIEDWRSTLYLFENEYKVPVVPFELAALFSTCVELTTPALLIVGFMTRLAAIPILAMTLVIQFTYLNSQEHIYWMLLLGILICQGPGKLSIDYVIKRKIT